MILHGMAQQTLLQVRLGEVYGTKVVKLAFMFICWILAHQYPWFFELLPWQFVELAYLRACDSSNTKKKGEVGSSVTLVEVDQDGVDGACAPIQVETFHCVP